MEPCGCRARRTLRKRNGRFESVPAPRWAIVKILVCHNFYQQPGGEDRVYHQEIGLLEQHGHQVVRDQAHNHDLAKMSHLAAAVSTVWSRSTFKTLRRIMRAERPSILHVHNTLPLLSPSVYYAAHAEGVAVVQTLHNYRLACANGLFFRAGRVCEDCLGRPLPWPGIVHRCYRDSRGATAAVAAMLSIHRGLRTWTRRVDAYVALTEFGRRKLIEAGLPPARVHVKGNFVSPDPGVGDGSAGNAVFVGRLSTEKGIPTLLAAWRQPGTTMPLTIIGDGPLAADVAAAARELPNVTWEGHRSPLEVAGAMKRAACVVVPSNCYEGFPLSIAEAFAAGTPVVTCRLGAPAELVDDGRTGELFRPGDSLDLAHAVRRLTFDADRLRAMRAAARAESESKFTADANYRVLLGIYAAALDHRDQQRNSRAAAGLEH